MKAIIIASAAFALVAFVAVTHSSNFEVATKAPISAAARDAG